MKLTYMIFLKLLARKMNIGNLYNVQASVFVKLTEPDRAMYRYVRLITMKSSPFCMLLMRKFVNFPKHNIIFGVHTFKETVFKLVKIVEAKSKMRRS